MNQAGLKQVFSQDFLDKLLPPERSDQFFDALYGDASEGAYDIRLECISARLTRVVLAFNLTRRPGKCLACSLTHGLPKVFARHPLININGMVDKMVEKGVKVKNWRLARTQEHDRQLHIIPFLIDLE